eukprot:6665623-Prorocentrum_lima.AAC.1
MVAKGHASDQLANAASTLQVLLIIVVRRLRRPNVEPVSAMKKWLIVLTTSLCARLVFKTGSYRLR